MTYDEAVKIADFKEQYRIITANVKDANKELEKVLTLNKEAEDKTLTSTVELVAVSLQLDEVTTQLKTTKQQLEKAQVALLLVENKYKEEIDGYTDKVAAIKAKITLTKQEHKDVIGLIKKEIKDAERELSNIQKKSKEALDESVNIKKEAETLRKSLKESIGIYNDLLADSEKLEKRIAKDQLAYEKKTRELAEKIEAEKEKIKRPMQLLEERTAIVVRRERNLEILADRTKKKFEKLYPGQELKY